jgi:hypothetical protein
VILSLLIVPILKLKVKPIVNRTRHRNLFFSKTENIAHGRQKKPIFTLACAKISYAMPALFKTFLAALGSSLCPASTDSQQQSTKTPCAVRYPPNSVKRAAFSLFSLDWQGE